MTAITKSYLEDVVNRQPLKGPACQYMLPEYHYLIAELQHTIGHVNNVSSMLNEEGKALLAKILVRIKNNDFTMKFDRGNLERAPSGMFHVTDRYKQDFPNCDYKICLCSKQNMVMVGTTPEIRAENPNSRRYTSNLIIYGDDWGYTKSGSLYGYTQYVDMDD